MSSSLKLQNPPTETVSDDGYAISHPYIPTEYTVRTRPQTIVTDDDEP